MKLKDNKLKEMLISWATYNEIENVICYIGDYDHGGIYIQNGITMLKDINGSRLEIYFWSPKNSQFKNNTNYSIKELME